MTEEQVLNKLTTLCARGEHCQQEMLDKMRRWEIDKSTQARVMEYLLKEKFIDEERYTRCFVEEKIKFNVEVTQTDKEGNKVTNTDEPVSKIKCISPVLVLPEPNSRSANLTTVPLNAEVDFIRNDNGWYYITYNGITGYAWGQFFTAPTTPTPH